MELMLKTQLQLCVFSVIITTQVQKQVKSRQIVDGSATFRTFSVAFPIALRYFEQHT
jgi:hypothetical protein